MTTIAAIDGGKSALRLEVVGPQGRWAATGPGFSYLPGRDDVASIVDAVTQAVARSGYVGRVDRLCAGLTGAPGARPVRERLRLALADLFGGATVYLVDDGLLAHAGALCGPGVVICAGTGAVATAVDETGRCARADGWGYLLGDRGSGFAIGRAGLSAALAARDGVGPPTILESAAAAHLGGLDLTAMQDLLRANDIPARVAPFAIAVLEHADVGDSVAQGIVRQAATDLAATAVAAANAAGLPPEHRMISYTGRLFHTGRLLLETLAEELSDRHLVPPRGDAIAGALALAGNPARPPYAALITAEAPPTKE